MISAVKRVKMNGRGSEGYGQFQAGAVEEQEMTFDLLQAEQFLDRFAVDLDLGAIMVFPGSGLGLILRVDGLIIDDISGVSLDDHPVHDAADERLSAAADEGQFGIGGVEPLEDPREAGLAGTFFKTASASAAKTARTSGLTACSSGYSSMIGQVQIPCLGMLLKARCRMLPRVSGDIAFPLFSRESCSAASSRSGEMRSVAVFHSSEVEEGRGAMVSRTCCALTMVRVVSSFCSFLKIPDRGTGSISACHSG
jgi:hypothetical protein